MASVHNVGLHGRTCLFCLFGTELIVIFREADKRQENATEITVPKSFNPETYIVRIFLRRSLEDTRRNTCAFRWCSCLRLDTDYSNTRPDLQQIQYRTQTFRSFAGSLDVIGTEYSSIGCTSCPKKKIPAIFDCNVKKDYQILIIFDTDISDTFGDQIAVQFSTALIVCVFHYLRNKTNEILHSYLILPVRVFPGSAEADIWWGGN